MMLADRQHGRHYDDKLERATAVTEQSQDS